MLATNHGMTGMLLGAMLPLPIALPVAFASHFIMDALPHYGIPQRKRNSSITYKGIVILDTLIALSFAVACAANGKWHMFFVGWVAYSPDGYWVYTYYKTRSFNIKPQNLFSKIHKQIQRYERPWGIVVELAVAALLTPLSLHYLLA